MGRIVQRMLFTGMEDSRRRENKTPKKRGRKPLDWRKGAPHRRRARFSGWSALHVTLSLEEDTFSIRTPMPRAVAVEAFLACKEKEGFRIIAWTVQPNHIHMVVEAASTLTLSRGVQGLQVRLAKGWNKLWNRKRGVFAGRFHARLIGEKEDPRKILSYVLKNHMRHRRVDRPCFDSASSALWMDIWQERDSWLKARKRVGIEEGGPVPLAEPRTEGLRWAVGPGALSLYGMPRGYSRRELLPAQEVAKEG